MILVANQGNTRASVLCYDSAGKERGKFAFPTAGGLSGEELFRKIDRELAAKGIAPESVEYIALGSVVPEAAPEWKKAAARFPALRSLTVLRWDHPWSFRLGIAEPSMVGLDRLANAEAALERFRPPFIVVDAGTAITFNVVGKDSQGPVFLGGAILAGPDTALKALAERTAQLPELSLSGRELHELPVVGDRTEAALLSGAVHGLAALVDGMVERIRREQNFPEEAPVIATGGFAPLLRERALSVTHFVENLTAEGYYAVAQKL